MELGRELDGALGRDGIKGIERISEGYGRECTIYRAQKWGHRNDATHSTNDTWRYHRKM